MLFEWFIFCNNGKCKLAEMIRKYVDYFRNAWFALNLISTILYYHWIEKLSIGSSNNVNTMHLFITYEVNRKYWSEAGWYLYCHKTRVAHRLDNFYKLQLCYNFHITANVPLHLALVPLTDFGPLLFLQKTWWKSC